MVEEEVGELEDLPVMAWEVAGAHWIEAMAVVEERLTEAEVVGVEHSIEAMVVEEERLSEVKVAAVVH